MLLREAPAEAPTPRSAPKGAARCRLPCSLGGPRLGPCGIFAFRLPARGSACQNLCLRLGPAYRWQCPWTGPWPLSPCLLRNGHT